MPNAALLLGASLASILLLTAPAPVPKPMPHDTARDSAELVVLNRGYVDSFINSDWQWYDAHLAADYECLCPDGSVVGRKAFIDGSRRPMSYKTFSLDSVRVKLNGDVALITAITPYKRKDGTTGVSRYTDTWVRQGGAWKTWQAQITPVKR